MGKLIESFVPSCSGVISQRKTTLYAVSAFLIAVATSGCNFEVETAESAGAAPAATSESRPREAREEPGSLPRSGDAEDDIAPSSLSPSHALLAPSLVPTASSPVLGCAPLCTGGCNPVKLADKSGLDSQLLLHGDNVFFGGAITYEAPFAFWGRVPKAGGPTTLFHEHLVFPPKFVSDGITAYSVVKAPSASSQGELDELALDGTVTEVASYRIKWFLVAMDPTNIYWWNTTDRSVRAKPRSGGSSTLVTNTIYTSDDIAVRDLKVDNTSVYIVTDNVQTDLSTIWRAPKTGPADAIELVTVPGAIVSLAMDATDLYFADRVGSLYKKPKIGGPVVDLTQSATEMSIAVDAERYYWFNGAALTATCKDGSGSQVLATVSPPGATLPEILKVDSSGVYWYTYSEIWKIAK